MFRTLILALGLGACGGNGNQATPLDLADDLGEWSNSDLSCDSNSDCLTGEVCDSGSCQIERCAVEIDASRAPMGEGIVFFEENELAFADTATFESSYWIDAYRPVRDDNYDHSWNVGNSRPNDVAGGNFDGERTEQYAVASQGSTLIALAGTHITVDAGFIPVALDTGDVDGDGLDEVVALANNEKLSICHFDTGVCELWTFDDSTAQRDVAVGDFDGDSYEEITVLLDIGGDMYLYGFNPHGDITGETASYWQYIDSGPYRITAGDLDGDWVEEIIGLVDPWWCLGLCDDEVHVIDAVLDSPDFGSFNVRYYNDVNGMTDTADLVSGDTDHDDVDEVLVLGVDGKIQLMNSNGGSALNKGYETRLDTSVDPDRVAMADHDGDAPRAYKSQGPQRVEGAMVPLMVLVMPPYDADHSSGVSFAGYGDTESVNEEFSDSVSLGLNADVGTNPSFFGLFGTKLSAKVGYHTTNIIGDATKVSIGSRYYVDADPEQFGPKYGGVVLSWGCFDAYEYVVDDPGNFLGGADDEPIVMTVPVGGGEALYSSTRYNAIAENLGTLPTIDIPYTVGDVDSYPKSPERLKNGNPIDPDDMLFPETEAYVVSDVGRVLWWNVVGESSTNLTLTDYSFGASAGVTAFGVSVGGGAEYGWGNGYSMSVGSDASFIGGVPPVPDDLDTPEDEFATYGYRVQPHVYQETWKDALGNQSAYYVMTYSVGE